MVAAAAVRPVRTAMVGLTAVGMTLIVGFAEDIGGGELAVRIVLALAGSALAVFVARTRKRGERKLTAVETVAGSGPARHPADPTGARRLDEIRRPLRVSPSRSPRRR